MTSRVARSAVVFPLRSKWRRVVRRPAGRRRVVIAVLVALTVGVVVNLATRPRLTGGGPAVPPLESGAALEDWSDSAGQAALRSRRLIRLASECPTASADRRRAVLDSFAQWSDDVLRLVACRRIKPGFTAEQLRAAWGVPVSISPDMNGMLPIEQWDYGHRSVLISDGRVKSWQ
ncbi:MAG TPA: hypothetical protein VFM14_11170 [Gemmatimonadales bacterium]|nr:hypothetical protein [Gemmatimonadales bacterium]